MKNGELKMEKCRYPCAIPNFPFSIITQLLLLVSEFLHEVDELLNTFPIGIAL